MDSSVQAIVTDIEGTTTSVSFVYDILFPYAKRHLPDYIRAHAKDPVIAKLLEEVRKEADLKNDQIENIIPVLNEWMAGDKKNGSLKALQGIVWEKGFLNGAFRGHLYEDAYRNLKKWHSQKIPLYVYSSGSVQAQKLLFGYSDFGDLTPLFSGYFDTAIGGKKESDSYVKIIQAIGKPASSILFLSDVVEELDAAKEAGMKTTLVSRSAVKPETNTHQLINTFDEL